jgi:superfamily I DNA/RNA helicase
MAVDFLINPSGEAFPEERLEDLYAQLSILNSADRFSFRNENADAISQFEGAKILIVSGPGTGKSTIFLKRITNWLKAHKDSQVVVTSFVRKLVADLQRDIANCSDLSKEQKGQITASTLHKLARSIVEKNHGTKRWPFKPHFRVIAPSWKQIVWEDVVATQTSVDIEEYSWNDFAVQLHQRQFEESDDWKKLIEGYGTICKFYNAAGFDDLIIRAESALTESPGLVEAIFFIVDEYQDFNLAEQAFIVKLVENCTGHLVVGDDEQVLYENLKSGTPSLIRELYSLDTTYAKAMLPFCGRSSFHITTAADHFINDLKEAESIKKIYLPLQTEDENPKVQVIACATPATAVGYILKFLKDNQAEIDERRDKLLSSEAKDAFLLILTPQKSLKFFGKEAPLPLLDAISAYRPEDRSLSEDYYRILAYYSVARFPSDNFTFRKVLYYENVDEEETHATLASAIENCVDLCDFDSNVTKEVLDKCYKVLEILESGAGTEEIVERIQEHVWISNPSEVVRNIDSNSIVKGDNVSLILQDDEEAELENLEITSMAAVELMSIIGAKGLSADHVILVGFDNVNMNYITPNAFYVAITRPRKSLHLLTALRSGGSSMSSEYLNSLPAEHVDLRKFTKTGERTEDFASQASFEQYFKALTKFKSRG